MAEKNRKEELEQIEDRVRTIGVLTSGGDAPGMNAAIRAVVRTAIANGIRVCGIRRGYHGLLKEEIIELTARDVADTIQRGGSPTCKDRVYASVMGAKAVELLMEGKSNRVVGYRHGEFIDFDINDALSMKKEIPAHQYEISKTLAL